jgi:hypothetical protein
MIQELLQTKNRIGLEKLIAQTPNVCPLLQCSCIQKGCSWFEEAFNVCAVLALAYSLVEINAREGRK